MVTTPTATTFAPDWDAIATQARDRWEHVGGEHWHDSWLAVIAAHGYVVVDREDLIAVVDEQESSDAWASAVQRLKIALGA